MRRQQDKSSAFQEVVGLLYEAAVTPDQWPDALDRLHQLFGSVAAHLFLWDKGLDRPLASKCSTTYEGRTEALQYYLRIDPRRLLLARQPVGSPLLCHEHFDDEFVRRNEFFQDYSLPLGRRYLMAINLREVGTTSSILALLRSPGQGHFAPSDRLLLEQVSPHLRRAVIIHERLEQFREEADVAGDLLDGVLTCLIATDADARIVRMNRVAEAVLRPGRGVQVVNGRLAAPTHTQTQNLRRLINQAVATAAGTAAAGGGGMIVESLDGERQGVMVMPLSRRSATLDKPEVPLALVSISSLAPQVGPDRYLAQIFGLTPCEAHLASEIGAGQRLESVAEKQGVRLTTLRTQLRAIFDKTGTSRQAELVYLLSKLPRPHDRL